MANQNIAFLTIRIGVGSAVFFWGLLKLLFVAQWVGPYQNVFYTSLPISSLIVYVLGAVQIIVAIAIIADFYRVPAALIGALMAGVSLLATLINLITVGGPVVNLEAPPLAIKMVQFLFDPLAIFLTLIGVALMPSSATGAREG